MKTFLLSERTPESAGRQRGLVVVELAILLPLIILIMFATAELGRAFYQYTTLTKAVQAGTRYYASAVNDLTITTDKELTTRNLIATASPDGSGAAVLPGFGIGDVTVDAVFNDHVRVSATYNFDTIIGNLPIINRVVGDGLAMTAAQSLRIL